MLYRIIGGYFYTEKGNVNGKRGGAGGGWGGGAIAERRQQKDEEIEQKKNPTRTRIKRKKSTEKRVNRFDDVADRNSVTTR